MLVSVEKNFIFFHVAKTGGQSMRGVLNPYALPKARGQWRRLLSHLPVPEGLDSQLGIHTPAWWAKLKLPGQFFDNAFKFAFVRNPYDLAVSKYSFLRMNIHHRRHNTVSQQTFGEFLETESLRTLWRRDDQTRMLVGLTGDLIVDHVYRFEQLGEAWQDLVRRLDLQDAKQLPHRNPSSRTDYKTYYGPAERKLVERIWARDLDRFGYTF